MGYDWKIGIALITSFAAREVFVGTMATLYSVGDDKDENNTTLQKKMNAAYLARRNKSLYTCDRLIFIYFLCACHAMHEHTCHCKKRNTKLEMARYNAGIYDRPCLHYEFYNLSYLFSFNIKPSNQFTNLTGAILPQVNFTKKFFYAAYQLKPSAVFASIRYLLQFIAHTTLRKQVLCIA